jgi:hypothetical protein
MRVWMSRDVQIMGLISRAYPNIGPLHPDCGNSMHLGLGREWLRTEDAELYLPQHNYGSCDTRPFGASNVIRWHILYIPRCATVSRTDVSETGLSSNGRNLYRQNMYLLLNWLRLMHWIYLQAWRSRVRVPIKSFNFFFNLPNPSSRSRPWGLLGL